MNDFRCVRPDNTVMEQHKPFKINGLTYCSYCGKELKDEA